MRVLIVEDEPIQSLVLEKLLRTLNYEIVAKAESGREAIDTALKLRPDLITMDIMLTDDIDGIEAALRIQEELDTILVYVSGNMDDNILERAADTHYKKFFKKPYDIHKLRDFFKNITM